MARFLIFTFTLLFCSQAPLLGQSASGKTDQTATVPDVLLSLSDPNQKIVSWRNLRIQYTIVNGSLRSGIGVNSLDLSLPSDLALTSSTLGRTRDGSIKLVDSAFQMRTPGERRDFAPIELRAKYFSEVWGQFFSLLTYRGQKEIVVATLEYQPLDGDTVQTKTARLELNVAPNPLGIYVGAVCGALLIALLIPIHRFARNISQEGASMGIHFHTEALRAFGNAARGLVASGIAVLILQTTANFNFPISVTVQDFYGGVLLGLFGDKVSEQILNRIGAGAITPQDAANEQARDTLRKRIVEEIGRQSSSQSQASNQKSERSA